MRKQLKNYLIPHEGNDHKPNMLCGMSVTVLALIAVVVFAFSAFHGAALLKNSDFLAAILPGVLVDLANEDREDNDLVPLTPNPILEEAAQRKAEHMAEEGYFAHESPDGVTPWDWFIEVGYQFTHAGENLAVNFVDSEDVEEAWMNSPGHRANILNGSFTEVGIATAKGEFEGRDTIFVVQMFGRPALAQAPVAPTSAPQVAEASTDPEPEPAPEPIPVPEPAPAPQPEPQLEVVIETPTFVAVQDAAQIAEEERANEAAPEPTVPVAEDVSGVEAAGLTGDQSSFWERLVTQPQTILEWIYIVFGIILLLVLTATIIVEIEKQHPKHIIYGVLLLVLLLVLIYLNHKFVFPELLVI
jgi:hypothetical protein